VRIGAAELASSDIALHLNNEIETAQSANQEMGGLIYMAKFFVKIKQAFFESRPFPTEA